MLEMILEFLRNIFGPEKPNSIDYLKIVLEYLKLFLSTPVLTVGLIYVLVNKFHSEFRNLLMRVTALFQNWVPVISGIRIAIPVLRKNLEIYSINWYFQNVTMNIKIYSRDS